LTEQIMLDPLSSLIISGTSCCGFADSPPFMLLNGELAKLYAPLTSDEMFRAIWTI
jgi:hypothetical protein